ncbi:MAG: S41 family peptidase [Bacteroidia bacterium]
MKSSIYLFALSLLILTSACREVLIGEPVPNTVINSYELFAQDFEEHYGIFQVKNVNWPALVDQYRTPLTANSNDDGLYDALTGLITELDDSHLFLYAFSDPNDPMFFGGGIAGRLNRQNYEDLDLKLVFDKYVSIIDSVSEIIYYGTLADNIGYIYLPEIYDEPSFFEQYMPQVIEDLKDTKGIVIDIRDNGGGEDESSKMIASFFADQRRLYMISRYKIGPGPDEFEEPREWYVAPYAGERYDKPVVLLTNRYSVSAAETFSFAMKTFPQVSQVGDTTTGAFSDVVTRELPNGWLYGVSVGDYRNADNINLESIGIAPDVVIVNTPQDLAAGNDLMLERAIDELR